MGRKAKLKKTRKHEIATTKPKKRYDETQFVKQFEKMGYQLKIDPQLQLKTNRGNISPEIPQDTIEPQL
ncbi:hypothetical protein IQ255_15195 [Pleurocapsales cyanobacterium LEGE 10410]|nr:hypothetical protein [Pleurocapsales cyanobacterium LEGE 10410]